MGAQLRTGDVTTATDSITQYARYCELRANGQLDEAATVLKEIEDYNLYDCRSTRGLRDWLMMRAFESGVTPLGAQPVSDGGDSRTQTRSPTPCTSSPATRRPVTAPPSRQRSPWSPPPAAITAARTSRSGGRTSTG